MNETHLTDEQLDLLRAGMEARAAWASHLNACASCQARFQQWAGARPAPDAALVLGTAIRAHDWNDTYLSKEPAHPSDNICAAMAVAEAEERTGRDLITGIGV